MTLTAPVSATARVRQAYLRLAEVDRPEVWITLRPEADALVDAALVDARVAAGETLELAGLTIAVKDNIDVAGLPTTAAHPEFSYLPTDDATAVARLTAAGAVVLGKTNLDQFATGLVGTRSPYGAVRDARRPDRISGGSSSGSAVAVALGVADIGLGTDTAGSGRVPAALQGIVGIKPTRGLISTRGMVSAIPGLDCISIFARDLSTALLAGHRLVTAPGDGPHDRIWPADAPAGAPPVLRVGVARAHDLSALSSPYLAAYNDAVADLESIADVVLSEVDLAPFLAASALLYGGGFVAARHAAVGEFLSKHPNGADPTVAALIGAAGELSASGLAQDQNRLAELAALARRSFAEVDVLLLPTTTRHPLISEVVVDPVALNAELGTFTNFCNLLDLCAVAVPWGEADGGPFGVTVVAPAFADRVASDASERLTSAGPVAVGLDPPSVPLVVFGAHLKGEPLNHQLEGARLLREVRTAPEYRLFALDTRPPKPGLVRVNAAQSGAAIAGEVWLTPPATVARLLAGLPGPLTLGRVRLEDGSEVVGFLCESIAVAGARDITEYGSWRAFLAGGDPLGSVQLAIQVGADDGAERGRALEMDGVTPASD